MYQYNVGPALTPLSGAAEETVCGLLLTDVSPNDSHHIPPDGKHPFGCDYEDRAAEDTARGGYLAMQKLLQNHTIPPALITASDDQAAGVMKAVLDEHISIPENMALACLTDSATCSILDPPVTALETPSRRLGMVAARMLFDSIEGSDELYGPQEIILQPKLKIRRSCGNTKPIYELFG